MLSLFKGAWRSTLAVHSARRLLHHSTRDCAEGAFIVEMRNSRLANESVEDYQNRAWGTVLSFLKPNTFYIYVDQATVKKFVYPGHIASFLTDNDSKPIPASCMSLRKGQSEPGKVLIYKLDHAHKEAFVAPVGKVEFVSVEHELKEYFFKRSSPEPLGQPPRYFIGVPLKLLSCDAAHLIDRVQKAIEHYKNDHYLLADGTVAGVLYKALNCVTGFYHSQGVQGGEANPSPQMAATSWIAYFLGQEIRNEIVSNSELRKEDKRQHDDQLHPLTNQVDSSDNDNKDETKFRPK